MDMPLVVQPNFTLAAAVVSGGGAGRALDSGTWCLYARARLRSWHLVPLIREADMAEQAVAVLAEETEALAGDELLVEEVSIDGMCGVY
jgi:mycofactocin precursor